MHPLNNSLNLALYEKAHQSAALFNRTACSKIEVSGSDHLPFLHNIFSQDVLAMQPNEWRETALLSATSHVLAYMFVVKLEKSLLLISAPETSKKIISLLESFHIVEDVQICSADNDWFFFEAWGPQAESMLKKASPHFMSFKPEGLSGSRIVALVKSTETLPGELSTEDNSREILRIENGILEFKKDFDENMMLSETRLEKKAASETKGCYPGQEVVAKIETYKRLNRSFVKLSWVANELPEKNAILSSALGEEIGRLTSRAYSPSLKKSVGLGWLKRGFFEQPVEISIKSKTTIPAIVVPIKN